MRTSSVLLAASTVAFGATLRGWFVFEKIVEDDDLKKRFLSAPRQQELFVRSVMKLLCDDTGEKEISVTALVCEAKHESVKGLVRRFFNGMVKNFIRKISENERAKSSQKKMEKLSGKY